MKMNAKDVRKTAKAQSKSQMLRAVLVLVLLATLGILSSGCARSAGSETVRQIGNELNEVLPTVSEEDTTQSIEENATFREVFFSIFPQFRP
jgi:hypothetical protein